MTGGVELYVYRIFALNLPLSQYYMKVKLSMRCIVISPAAHLPISNSFRDMK